jgi:general secretion pathway protein J
MSRRAEHGFTLIEVMISLLIFGLLAAAGVALLSFSVRAQGLTGARLEAVSARNRLSAILTADLAQAVVRPTRGEGGEMLPAFIGEPGTNGAVLLRVVRPSEQKVEYRLEDGALVRVAYPMLDGAPALPPTPLLSHIRTVALRYRLKGAWSDRWVGNDQNPLPDALELRIVRDPGDETREMFLVGTGYGKRVTNAR